VNEAALAAREALTGLERLLARVQLGDVSERGALFRFHQVIFPDVRGKQHSHHRNRSLHPRSRSGLGLREQPLESRRAPAWEWMPPNLCLCDTTVLPLPHCACVELYCLTEICRPLI
jgi:hypothetical protein